MSKRKEQKNGKNHEKKWRKIGKNGKRMANQQVYFFLFCKTKKFLR